MPKASKRKAKAIGQSAKKNKKEADTAAVGEEAAGTSEKHVEVANGGGEPAEVAGHSKASKLPSRGPLAESFECHRKSSDGRKWTMKFSSWNVNGLRAWLDKKGEQFIGIASPDVLGLQEIKCSKEKLPVDRLRLAGYEAHWSHAEKEGYAGTGLLCKKNPLNLTYGIGNKKHDSEGRTITAEFEKFYFVTCYVPNSGAKLVRHSYRTKEWDAALQKYLLALDKKKPVIFCGDLNVSHLEIDLTNPKSNQKTAGFTIEERDNFGDLLSSGFVDTFRTLYPEDTGAYTFWSYMRNARQKNIGWRLDYFLISKRLESSLCDSVIHSKVLGSDHCPITLFMAL